MATQDNPAYLQGGRFYRGQAAQAFKADDMGRFTLTPRRDEPFLLVAVHEGGYAQIGRHEFSKSGEIKLQPWARIEGRVMLGREPDANREVSFWPKTEDNRFSYAHYVHFDYKTKTDADGRFTLDRVIPAPGNVARVVVTEFIGSSQHTPSWQVPVDLMPGGTASVMIGGTGRPVIGQVKLDRQPDVAIDWTTNEPVQVNLQEEKEPRTYFRCAGNIDTSGRFRIPDVPAGKYKLSLRVNNPPAPNACGAGDAIGTAALDFVVPPMTDNRSDEPLDLGTITATLFDTLDPGEEAPDFVLPGLAEGQTVRLSKLRGKLVLLDFWATWCGPCLAEMPALREIQQEFGGHPRFVMISLACDQQPEPPKRYVAENALNWTHAFAGAAGSGIGSIAAKYTVRSLPGTFLIGPDGRVLAKNLRGAELKRAVAAALADGKLFESAKTNAPPARFPVAASTLMVRQPPQPKNRLCFCSTIPIRTSTRRATSNARKANPITTRCGPFPKRAPNCGPSPTSTRASPSAAGLRLTPHGNVFMSPNCWAIACGRSTSAAGRSGKSSASMLTASAWIRRPAICGPAAARRSIKARPSSSIPTAMNELLIPIGPSSLRTITRPTRFGSPATKSCKSTARGRSVSGSLSAVGAALRWPSILPTRAPGSASASIGTLSTATTACGTSTPRARS
jgi:thiol-disulfide isomerase/thioredoxin